MTITLLASVSLFALVVTSRPILPNCDLAPAPSALQTVPQGVFQIHPGKDDLKLDAPRFQFQIQKPQIECFSAPDTDSIAAAASFEISPEAIEAPVDEPAGGEDAFDVNDDFTTDEPVMDGQPSAAPLVVLAFSCVAAFLALACVALTLYIIKSLRSQMLSSKTAWELLPRFWGHPSSQGRSDAKPAKYLSGGCRPLLTDRLVDAELGSAEGHGVKDKPLYFDTVSDLESDCEDVDEKYQDALDTTPLPLIHDLPPEENVSHPSHLNDPCLLPPGIYPLDQSTGDRTTFLMRELCSPPVFRPAWSVRAIDSPALGISSREGDGVASIPQPLVHPRRRAYRSAVPEFDVALAMQLRPGLGIGSDPAWMVRFLMTIFGWFAVALTGHAR